jgi:uncharacterized protein
MTRPAIVGYVVGVHGPRINVELADTVRSPVRAGIDGAHTVVAINAYLAFDLGAGETAIGVVTDLDARETWDPSDNELSLQLTKPRRVATVQLLGTVKAKGNGYAFDPGIAVLPTLDTPAETIAGPLISTVLSSAPRRNVPPGEDPDQFDGVLSLGSPTASLGLPVVGSYNDLFSRPLAVVGNTGSGKSCSIAGLIQTAVATTGGDEARFFILDINGEYGSAFDRPSEPEPNCMYVNGKEFGVPIWLLNAREICDWLSATEQVQEPVLKNLWSMAKGAAQAAVGAQRPADIKLALNSLTSMIDTITGNRWNKGKNAWGMWNSFIAYAKPFLEEGEARQLATDIHAIIKQCQGVDSSTLGDKEKPLTDKLFPLRELLAPLANDAAFEKQASADKPIPFALSVLHDPRSLLEAAKSGESDGNIEQYLRGLMLRLRNRLNDRRWRPLLNSEELKINSLADWVAGIGIGKATGPVTVIDLSMVGQEVLPYVCGVIGRVLLDLREHAAAQTRFQAPWVIVLEEAHNYVRPRRQEEDRGISISRDAFERIAKEGRKFGLSLMVASQRPSEISPTIISQCANFVMHRLQNPDDIEHFRSIVPSQSRRLLDQVTVLAPGEGIVLGSAFNIPARVRMNPPLKAPSSRSPSPFRSWSGSNGKEVFNVDAAIGTWLAEQ